MNSISYKSSLGYLVILLMTIIAAAMLYTAIYSVRDKVEVFVDHTLPALNHIQAIDQSLSEMEIHAYELYSTTISLKKYSQIIEQVRLDVSNSLLAYQKLRGGDVEQLDFLLNAVDSQLMGLKKVMAANSVDWDKARDTLAALSIKANDGQQYIQQIKQTIQLNANSSAADVSEMLSKQAQLLLTLIVLILVVVIVAYSMAKRIITSPIISLSNDIEKVASNYDLQYKVKKFADDEIGDIAVKLNSLLQTLSKALAEVSHTAQGTQNSSASLTEISSASDRQIDSLNAMIASLVETALSLEQHISEQVLRSEAAAETANKGADEVELGASHMHETSTSIDELADDVEKASNELIQLHETSAQVAQVVSTIADIAEQTNLLALNAAIEAARAGESGRGFAVVADEVRTLATRTQQSTVEINKMLDALVQSINSVVAVMNESREKAVQSVSLGQNMVEVLNTIRQTILSVSKESCLVAKETEVARERILNISHDVQQFSSIGENVAADSLQIRQQAEALNEHSMTLHSTVAKFKI